MKLTEKAKSYSGKKTLTLKIAKSNVGPGWSKLIEKIWLVLPNDVIIEQIKEKFGGLRFYVANVSEEVMDYIHQVESESETVCENCGNPGKLYADGWWRTLCIECEDKRKQDVKG